MEIKNPMEVLWYLDAISSIKELHDIIRNLEVLISNNSGKACYVLSVLYSPSAALQEELKQLLPVSEERSVELSIQAFSLLMLEAEAGDGESMYLVAIYYKIGFPPILIDNKKYLEWCEKAFHAGYIYAANDLHQIYSDVSLPFFNKELSYLYKNVLHKINVVPEQ